jgi:flagellar biogenesis protein FliO
MSETRATIDPVIDPEAALDIVPSSKFKPLDICFFVFAILAVLLTGVMNWQVRKLTKRNADMAQSLQNMNKTDETPLG